MEKENVNPDPSFIDTERGKYLLNKWKKIIAYNDNMSLSGSNKRLSTAIVMEAQERWIGPHKPIEPEIK